MRLKTRNQEAGFTLVELAIVLVIIGLIVGGVLVGQDLIKAAEIRAVVSDFEKYNAAANTFRTKYNGLPGDILAARAGDFGLTAAAGTDGLGDGDSSLENGAVAADKRGVGGENTLLWRHLSEAGLSNSSSLAAGTVATALTAADLPDYLPNARIREAAYIHAYGSAGRNYYLLTNISAVAATTGAITDTGSVLTNYEAKNIDEKMDDGIPTRGSITAVIANFAADAGAAPALGQCVDQGAAAAIAGDESYLLNVAGNTTVQDEINCALSIRASF